MDFNEAQSYIFEVEVDVSISDEPVVGSEIIPNVSVTPEGPLGQLSFIYKWYIEEKTCSVHPDKLATFQCMPCVNLKIPIKESYHCTTECFKKSWQAHQKRHHDAMKTIKGTLVDDMQTGKELRSCGSWSELDSGSLTDERAAVMEDKGKNWLLVSTSSTYVPKMKDLGLSLKLECLAIDSSTGTVLSKTKVNVTDPVIFPTAKPRCMVQIGCLKECWNLNSTSCNGITFSVLSYNILSDLYTHQRYRHCPPWALDWGYRRENLLREIIRYNADIICLQEVQSDHFKNFLEPELTKFGYLVTYKRRASEVYTANQYVGVGCATFYKHSVFEKIGEHEVEFDQKTSFLVEALEPQLREEASIRLNKDNVALLVILETLQNSRRYNNFRSRICVVNTHICSSPELPDVKIFQVVTLMNELENILHPEVPLLICGDFNSVPQSEPHSFIVTGSLDNQESADPYGVYQHLRHDHRFSLASAYANYDLAVGVQERQSTNFNSETKEPIFTYCRQRFSNTLDYIFYTVDSLGVEGLLELLGREDVGPGLPSRHWSSDHVALMASFRILARKPETFDLYQEVCLLNKQQRIRKLNAEMLVQPLSAIKS